MNPQTKVFCTFSDWHPHLPDEFKGLSEAAWLQRSRRGTWATYMKVLSEKSVAQYKRSDISVFFHMHFSEAYPEAVASLLAAGFPKPALSQPAQ